MHYQQRRPVRRAGQSENGWVTERSIVHAWKACVLKGTRGSNPRPSAILRAICALLFVFLAAPTRAQIDETTAGNDPVALALREYQEGNLEKALSLLDEAEKRGTRTSQALDIRGCVLMEQGKYDEAIKAFEASREADPKIFSRVPPPIRSSASNTTTSSPARASSTAPARPFGPEPTTTARPRWPAGPEAA